ncbi:histamine H2 receptor-like [Mya arenaria]|uniref:histamine H2 receptor-like n=1 Tax=Mya arenaria TaxID=6604 RepID=UPI0022E8314C|nr:histamine H2 receptor-like [Mya arenaria]
MHFKNESCDRLLFYGLKKEDYNIIWDVVDTVMFLPTVFGNTLILISIVRFRKLRTKIHILIGHLAVNDLLVGATLLPLEALGDTFGMSKRKGYCLAKLSAFALLSGGSCLGLLLISLERFCSVAFPLRHAFFTKTKLSFVMLFGWIYVGFWTLSPAFGCNNIKKNETEVECNASVIWGGWCKFGMNVNFVLSLVINVGLYLVVVVTAVRRVKEHGRQTGTSTCLCKSREMSKTVTMAAVLGLFALFWLPYAAMTLIITIQDHCVQILYHVRRWFLLLGLFNCSINWIIYGLRNKDFREAFSLILKTNKLSCRRDRKVGCATKQCTVNVIEMDTELFP